MKFTDAQVALFRSGISFVHMAPTLARLDEARKDFKRALEESGTYWDQEGQYDFVQGHWDSPRYVSAHFMLCVMCGASTEHVPVMFVDGKDEEFRDQRALEEAMFIPAPIDGVGPMVVR